MKGVLKKISKTVGEVEDAVFTKDGERKIDMSLPGIKHEVTLKKHKRGIYSAKRKYVNYPLLIIAGIIFIGALLLSIFS